jgi:POT family proton-dependent oligopeptide transporter
MAIEEIEALPGGEALERQPQFLGHPVGLYVIAFTEAFERFSYYGMQVLLVLYMVKQLLLPGHVEHIAGFETFRVALAHLYGATPTDQALSSHIFGLYTSLVYLTPIAGGVLADRWLGKTRAVTLGALLMAAGHFLMAFDVSFLLALLLLVLGVGCLKGNLASQVGLLYPAGDNRTADAFQFYYIGINAGVIISPLICGFLGEKIGWHWGFGAAGVGMVVGLLIYRTGRRYLPPDPKIDRVARAEPKPAMTRRDWLALALLLFMIPVLAVGALGNQQLYNAYLIWADRSYALDLFGMRMPTSFLATLDAVTGVATLIGVVAFWRWFGRHWREPDEVTKIAIGCFISSLAFVLLALASGQAAATGAKVSLWVAVAVHTINGIGFSNVFPVSLALYSRAAPRAIAGTIIGVYYLFLFTANALVGWIGGWLDTMQVGSFWMLHVGLIVAAGVVFLVIKLLFGRQLQPSS